MAAVRVIYDSNDGNHRWYNLNNALVGLRWIRGTGVGGERVKIKKNRVIAIERKKNG